VNLKGTLTRVMDGAGVSGKSISFKVDGTAAGSATTDATGVALDPYTVPEGAGPGTRSITAAFASDGDYNGSTGSGTMTVTKGRTPDHCRGTRAGLVGTAITLGANVAPTGAARTA